MDRMKNEWASIDEYIASFPEEIRVKLEALRATIRQAAPEAQEKISYQMPAFAQGEVLVYFAAFKHHIGFFPTSSGVEAFKEELSVYKGGRGSIQFPLDQPLPLDLVSRMVRFRADEVAQKVRRKQPPRKGKA